MRRTLLLALIAVPAVMAQTYRVALEVRTGEMQSMALGLEVKIDDATHLHAALPGGGEIRMERLPAPLPGVIAQVPGGEPAAIALLPDQWSQVTLNRTVGQAKSVPYFLEYVRKERDGKLDEALVWLPSYRAEGTLKLPGCELHLAVMDLNGDGVFDRKDSSRATTLALDVNNDHRFRGAAEWRKMEEIIEVCGSALEVAELDPTGVSIAFRVSELKPPTLNGPVPEFSVPTATGQLLRSSDFRGKVHVLDFWASWCGPCVEALDKVDGLAREYEKDVKVYGIDVDESERRAAADRIIREKALSYPMVIREQGERDFLWKMFGSMSGTRLSIPLYVIVDRQGMIRYASGGGEDLAELKSTLQQVLKTPEK